MARKRRKKTAEAESAVVETVVPAPTTGVTLNYTTACQWLMQERDNGLGWLADVILAKAQELGVENEEDAAPVPPAEGVVTCNPVGIKRWVEALTKNATPEEKACLVGLYAASKPQVKPRRRRRRG